MSRTAKSLSFTLEPKPPMVEQFERAWRKDQCVVVAQNLLVGADGTRIAISGELFEILKQAIPALESRRATVTISPAIVEFTTQQAADILNVSRPFLIKLLEQGEIDHVMVGTHRRIRREDLEQYKLQRDTQRNKILDELTELMEE
jgi:excisionase family DNA binding protein